MSLSPGDTSVHCHILGIFHSDNFVQGLPLVSDNWLMTSTYISLAPTSFWTFFRLGWLYNRLFSHNICPSSRTHHLASWQASLLFTLFSVPFHSCLACPLFFLSLSTFLRPSSRSHCLKIHLLIPLFFFFGPSNSSFDSSPDWFHDGILSLKISSQL